MAHSFIRHGDRESMEIDCPLKEKGKKNSRTKALDLIKLYGVPELIVTSPYLRCRQTAEEMNSVLEYPVKIKVDTRLSEYSTRASEFKGEYDEATLQYEIPDIASDSSNPRNILPDIFTDPMPRVTKIYNKYKDDPRNIWFVTHGAIVCKVAELWSTRIEDSQPGTSARRAGGARDNGWLKGVGYLYNVTIDADGTRYFVKSFGDKLQVVKLQ